MDSNKSNQPKNILRAKRCLRCAAEFEYTRCTRKYCSKTCKQMDYMQRRDSLQTEVFVIQFQPEKKVGFFKRMINRLWKN